MESDEFKVDPQQLRAEAEQEPRRRGLDDYAETIRLLKDEKDLTFREIAVWLQQHGLNVDHNAVWRTYSKGTLERPARSSREGTARIEQPRVHDEAMPWMRE